jgi:hypothetical protein
MDASHQEDLQVQRMSLWLLKAVSVMAIFRGALYWTDSAPDIVNPGREERGLVSV